MNKYYHFTSYNNLDSISMYGLVPQNGDRCKSIDDERCAVFLSKGIDRAIIMYSSLYYYYIHNSGVNGLNIIEEFNKSNIRWKRTIESGINYDLACKMININNMALEKLKYFISCKSFSDYLGGDGCFLSVHDINNVVSKYPEDSICNEIIPPSNINVVVIRNKKTDDIIDSRDIVISYFMSNYNPDDLSKIVSDEAMIPHIYYLYQNNNNYMIYNNNNFYLQEIPINFYDYRNQKIKALINK